MIYKYSVKASISVKLPNATVDPDSLVPKIPPLMYFFEQTLKFSKENTLGFSMWTFNEQLKNVKLFQTQDKSQLPAFLKPRRCRKQTSVLKALTVSEAIRGISFLFLDDKEPLYNDGFGGCCQTPTAGFRPILRQCCRRWMLEQSSLLREIYTRHFAQQTSVQINLVMFYFLPVIIP